MSERSVSENNKLWEAAERVAEEVVAAKKIENEEERRKQKKRVVKLILLMTLIALIIVFASIAWFAMNRETSAGGMGISVSGTNFEITMLANSKDGIFKDPYHIAVHDEGSMYWEMTSTNNFDNYNTYVDEDHPADPGIKPGSSGVISFNVTPRMESINLHFDFEIIGYRASYNDVNNTPNNDRDDELVMTPLADLPDDEGVSPQNLLNGHILLFENKTETTINNVTTVTYSDPILSDQDMHRVFNRTITGKNTATQIDIYWVWPNTLSTLVDARSYTGISTVPICTGTSYTAITNNIETYPHYYMKGVASTDTIDAEDDIAAHYDIYGNMYDLGDNDIGMRVNYILIKLSVTEEPVGNGNNQNNGDPGNQAEPGGGE